MQQWHELCDATKRQRNQWVSLILYLTTIFIFEQRFFFFFMNTAPRKQERSIFPFSMIHFQQGLPGRSILI